MYMKMNSLLISALLSAGLMGCGSDASNPDAGAAPQVSGAWGRCDGGGEHRRVSRPLHHR
jgi:hypothetical protein